jgi:hypothetical protein
MRPKKNKCDWQSCVHEHRLILRRKEGRLYLNVRDWSSVLKVAEAQGWEPPIKGSPALLIGEMIGQDSARSLADALNSYDTQQKCDSLHHIRTFCKDGAFLVDKTLPQY